MKTTSLNVGKVIYECLRNLPVYPLVAPAETRMPYIVYRRSQLSCADSKDVMNYLEYAYIDILVVADRYEQSLETASEVKERLEHFRGKCAGVQVSQIDLVGGQEDYINDCFVQSLQFRVEIEI